MWTLRAVVCSAAEGPGAYDKFKKSLKVRAPPSAQFALAALACFLFPLPPHLIPIYSRVQIIGIPGTNIRSNGYK